MSFSYICERPGDIILSGVDCSQPWLKGSVSWPLVGVPGCVMGLATSWMETLLITSRTEHSKLSESAQPTHCPGHLGSHFSSMVSSLLQGWMNYTRFLGHQTGEAGLEPHVMSATVPSQCPDIVHRRGNLAPFPLKNICLDVLRLSQHCGPPP